MYQASYLTPEGFLAYINIELYLLATLLELVTILLQTATCAGFHTTGITGK